MLRCILEITIEFTPVFLYSGATPISVSSSASGFFIALKRGNALETNLPLCFFIILPIAGITTPNAAILPVFGSKTQEK